MADINSFSKVEPEYAKVVIPITVYAQDECFMNPKVEAGNFLFPVEYSEEPEFVKMVIPISAYAQDDYFSYKDFESDSYISVVGNPNATQISKPDQPNAIM